MIKGAAVNPGGQHKPGVRSPEGSRWIRFQANPFRSHRLRVLERTDFAGIEPTRYIEREPSSFESWASHARVEPAAEPTNFAAKVGPFHGRNPRFQTARKDRDGTPIVVGPTFREGSVRQRRFTSAIGERPICRDLNPRSDEGTPRTGRSRGAPEDDRKQESRPKSDRIVALCRLAAARDPEKHAGHRHGPTREQDQDRRTPNVAHVSRSDPLFLFFFS